MPHDDRRELVHATPECCASTISSLRGHPSELRTARLVHVALVKMEGDHRKIVALSLHHRL